MRFPVVTIGIAIGLICLSALLWFPYTGILLMFVMAAFGPYVWGLLPHLLTVGILADVVSRRFPKIVLAVPALAYAVYYVFFALEIATVNRFERQLIATNPEKLLKYDPKIHSLVAQDAARIVQYYKVPVAFEENGNFPEGYRSSRLISRRRCSEIKEVERETFEFDTYGVTLTFGSNVWRAHDVDQCLLTTHEGPTKQLLNVAAKASLRVYNDTAFTLETFIVALNGSDVGSISTARVNRLPWFPFFIAGCGLNSANPSWDCFGQFYRTNQTLRTFKSDDREVDYSKVPYAASLGLEKYQLQDYKQLQDYPENEEFIDRWLAARQTQRPEDVNEWGVRNDSAYMPRIQTVGGYETYVGGIYSRKQGGEFYAFMKRNQGKVVYLDATIGSDANVTLYPPMFGIWGVCKEGQECARTDKYYSLTNSAPDVLSSKHIKGHWKVGQEELLPVSGDDKDTMTKLEYVKLN